MDEIKDFYQLKAWSESHKLVLMIYKETKHFPMQERYGIIDQMQRSVTSITANIAEGYGRYHYPDKIRFYHQARGSLKEVQNFIIVAKDLDYLEKKLSEKYLESFKILRKIA